MEKTLSNSNDEENCVYAIQPPYQNEPCPVKFEESDTPIYFDGRRTTTIILDFLIALIFPPLSVYRTRGCGCCLCLNFILCLMCWVPGMIHAAILSCI